MKKDYSFVINPTSGKGKRASEIDLSGGKQVGLPSIKSSTKLSNYGSTGRKPGPGSLATLDPVGSSRKYPSVNPASRARQGTGNAQAGGQPPRSKSVMRPMDK